MLIAWRQERIRSKQRWQAPRAQSPRHPDQRPSWTHALRDQPRIGEPMAVPPISTMM